MMNDMFGISEIPTFCIAPLQGLITSSDTR
jgi:hypothetical protein